jgi:MarR family transcriptional regulator, temperature-dependent positive regulator of motility
VVRTLTYYFPSIPAAVIIQSVNIKPSPTSLISDEQRLQLMRILSEQSDISQRDLAKAMGISVGSKTHYCLQALIEKGHVKVDNIRSNPIKRGYLYLITPQGLKEKGQLTLRFLDRKQQEYQQLQQEFAQLRSEIAQSDQREPESLHHG